MNLHDSYIDLFKHELRKTKNKVSLFNKLIRPCWFCQKDCFDYVSICENCRNEKFVKNKFKKLEKTRKN